MVCFSSRQMAHARMCSLKTKEKKKFFKVAILEYETKILEALLIIKLNPKLNKQLYAKGASFLSIFYVAKFSVTS